MAKDRLSEEDCEKREGGGGYSCTGKSEHIAAGRPRRLCRRGHECRRVIAECWGRLRRRPCPDRPVATAAPPGSTGNNRHLPGRQQECRCGTRAADSSILHRLLTL